MNQNVKVALIVGGVILVVLIVLPLVFGMISGWQGYGYGMMGPGMMGGFGGMWFMPVIWIVVLGLIIWVVVALARGSGESKSSESPLELLKRRYARGDISKEEYEAKKKDLLE